MATEKLVVKYLAWVLLCWLYHEKELLSTSEIFRDGGKFEFNWKVDWKITNVMCYRINSFLGGFIFGWRDTIKIVSKFEPSRRNIDLMVNTIRPHPWLQQIGIFPSWLTTLVHKLWQFSIRAIELFVTSIENFSDKGVTLLE